MNKKSDIEMERLKIAKTIRGIIRLKHSLKADEELNERLPDTLAEFDAAIQSGELKQLYSGVVNDILEE
jgi:hypothetical protein